MSNYHHVAKGLTLFLNSPPENYEPLANYFTFSVGAVPKKQRAGDAFALLGSKRVAVNQGGDWIRPPNGLKTQLFVHCKTRKKDPFFVNSYTTEWDGSLIGLFPTLFALEKFKSLQYMAHWLNGIDWEELGVLHAGRYQFTQRQLMNIVVPK